MTEVLKWTCDECSKELISLYPRQLEFLKKQHSISHEMKGGNTKMVSTEQALESQYVTAELVTKSPTKKLVVIEPGSYEKTDYGQKLSMVVNVDGKQKTWRPNKETVENLQVYGTDTLDWVGKVVNLAVGTRNGKQAVIGTAVTGEVVKEERVE